LGHIGITRSRSNLADKRLQTFGCGGIEVDGYQIHFKAPPIAIDCNVGKHFYVFLLIFNLPYWLKCAYNNRG